MAEDRFASGVRPGGLRDVMQLKILVCYLLNVVKSGLTREQLSEVLQGEEVANYFLTVDAVADLIKTGNITDENGVLKIAESGHRIAELLELDVPKSVREKTANSAIKLMTKARRESENRIDITSEGEGTKVTFTMFDNDGELMKLSVSVGDVFQAEKLKERFLEDPVKVYEGVISLLTD